MTWLILVTFHYHCGQLTWPRRTRHISWWPFVAATCKEVRPRVSLFFNSSVDLHNLYLYTTLDKLYGRSPRRPRSEKKIACYNPHSVGRIGSTIACESSKPYPVWARIIRRRLYLRLLSSPSYHYHHLPGFP